MNKILGGLFIGAAWVGFVSATFIWVIKFLYDLFALSADFWSSAFTNLGMWVLQLVVSFIVMFLGIFMAQSK